MSVINQMLNDLEKREQQTPLNSNQAVATHNPRQPVSTLTLVLLVLLIMAAAAVAYLWFNPQPGGTATQPESLNSEIVPPTTEAQPIAVQALQEDVAPQPILAKAETTHQAVEDIAALPPKQKQPQPSVATRPEQPAPDAVQPSEVAQAVATLDKLKQPTAPEKKTVPVAKLPGNKPAAVESIKAESKPAFQPAGEIKPDVPAVKKQSKPLSVQVGLMLNEARVAWHKQQREKAIAAYQRLIDQDPAHIVARKEYAQILAVLSRRDEAEQLLLQGIEMQGAPLPWVLTLAGIRAEQEQYADALQALAMVQTEPADPDYYSYQAALATRVGDFASAQEAYAWLTRNQPGVSRWWLGLAVSYEQRNLPGEAITAYRRALQSGSLSRKSQQFIQDKLQQLESRNGTQG